MLCFMLVFIWCLSHVLVYGTSECRPVYGRFSASHTACKPANSSCKIIKSGISAEDKALILREHNEYKSRIASGKEAKFGPSANMMQIEWDDELETVAQKHASQCNFEHDSNDCRQVENFRVGQNLYDRKTSSADPVPDWSAGIKSFFDEITIAPESICDNFEGGEYGHFSQMIWAKTWRMACGYAAFKTGGKTYLTEELYTCNYGPAGNTVGEKMYEKGNPASNCPPNTKASEDFAGLCKSIDASGPKEENITKGVLFVCDFGDGNNCGLKIDPINLTETKSILPGNYLSAVLKGNQSVVITLPQKYQSDGGFCIKLSQRKGANEAKHGANNNLTLTLTVPEINWTTTAEIGTDWPDWVEATMQVTWGYKTQISLKFEVPPEGSQQYLEIMHIVIYSGKCSQNE